MLNICSFDHPQHIKVFMLQRCRFQPIRLNQIHSRAYARLRPRFAEKINPLSTPESSEKSHIRNGVNSHESQPQSSDPAPLRRKPALTITADLKQTSGPIQHDTQQTTAIEHAPPLSPTIANDKQIITSIPPSLLWSSWEIPGPSTRVLQESRTFFSQNPARLSFSAQKLIDIPFTTIPEVAFLGRSNVGKSSLLNRLFASRTLAKVSKKAGKTKRMSAYTLVPAIGRNSSNTEEAARKHGLLSVLDMPGYGTGSREVWGEQIMRYLSKRRELRRIFVLIDCIEERGKQHVVKPADRIMLAELARLKIPHQIIVMKIDRCLFPRSLSQSGKNKALTVDKFGPGAEELGTVFAHVRMQIWDEKNGSSSDDGGSGGQRTMMSPPLRPVGQILGVSAENDTRYAYLSDGGGEKGALGIDAVRFAILQATGLSRLLPSEIKKEREMALQRRKIEEEKRSARLSVGAVQ